MTKKLPSKFQIGDVIGKCYAPEICYTVGVNTGDISITGKVVSVRFTENGEYYDILTDRAKIESDIAVRFCVNMQEVKPTEQ